MASSGRGPRRRGVLFYLTEQEQAEVAEVLRLEGLDAEIVLLRSLIKKRVGGEADAREVRLHIETLCKALRLQHQLRGEAAGELPQPLVQVLARLSAPGEEQA